MHNYDDYRKLSSSPGVLSSPLSQHLARLSDWDTALPDNMMVFPPHQIVQESEIPGEQIVDFEYTVRFSTETNDRQCTNLSRTTRTAFAAY